jgi:CubicO group peptidase (beta-lactamase class C family)
MDTFINGIIKDWNSAGGIAAAVVQGAGTPATWNVETKGYGISNAKGAAVDSDTLFSIGSNSKVCNFRRESIFPARILTNCSFSTYLPLDS